MKKRTFITGLLLACLLLPLILTSCGGQPHLKVQLGVEFSLPIGRTVDVVGQELSIRFDAVTGDSRCPTGVECIQAGEATCQMVITYQKTENAVVFTQNGGSISQAKFQNYIISFQLQPYPQVGQDIDKTSYVLEMIIAKT